MRSTVSTVQQAVGDASRTRVHDRCSCCSSAVDWIRPTSLSPLAPAKQGSQAPSPHGDG
ncbi:unnamed protein product [Chondrus crispus]|uniref:Uncharacterized protein n=1 Tax=Chondrus crispus TaxID=2769 RepID=R7QG17_CHOCR|nr:unnamed protein product [Chondrus crispus]CDF37462.1 unnamed protein product [Chondrus crispus]|eukprot:XP_005717281.1 unnamed protein product [Chondrus crispus]